MAKQQMMFAATVDARRGDMRASWMQPATPTPVFRKTTESFTAGARTLPQRYFVSPEIFAEEQAKIFARHWVCVGTKASSPGRAITSFSRWQVRASSWCAIRRAQCVDFTMFAATEGRGCARRRAGIARRSNVHITPGPMRLTADWLEHRTWMPSPASIRPIIRCML